MITKKIRKIPNGVKKYGKVYRIRKKKSIFGNRFFWLFILILMTLSGVSYLLFFSQFFQVKEIEIIWTPTLPPPSSTYIGAHQKVSFEDIQGLVKKNIEQKILFLGAPWEDGRWVIVSKSIFLVNLNKIKEKILKEFPQIAKVDLKREFPDKISIQIEEKEPIAIFCQRQDVENCFLIDEEGIIIEFVSIKDIPELTKIIGNIDSPNLGTKVIERNYLESILEIQKNLTENQKLEIKEFIPLEGKLTVQILEGWQIFFDPSGDISDQILNLAIILKEKITPENRGNLEYIDLRFGNKIYFKYR